MFVHEFNAFADLLLWARHALGIQRALYSVNQLPICVEQLLCVLGASCVAENKTAFMELISYQEGGGDK